jgi:CheY-like chemotaxis protein
MPVAVGRKSEGADGSRAANVAAETKPAGTLENPPPKPEVLIVEDDEDEVRFITRAIQRHGVPSRYKIVRTGEAALEYLESTARHDQRSPPAPKVVLLDLKLTGMDGSEVLKRIRAHDELCTIPVVILSSTSSADEICACYRSGANSFVAKPARSENPGSHVLEISRYWLDLNRPAGAP